MACQSVETCPLAERFGGCDGSLLMCAKLQRATIYHANRERSRALAGYWGIWGAVLAAIMTLLVAGCDFLHRVADGFEKLGG
jgi:hypothetical protein